MPYTVFLHTVGKKIKKCRTRKGLTQLELAVLCNIEKGHLSRIERGKTNPTLITLLVITDKLQMEFLDLFR
jgi:transcriptional regulator with XRE-family HTH domain